MAACQRLGHEAEYRGRVEARDEDTKGDFAGDGPADYVGGKPPRSSGLVVDRCGVRAVAMKKMDILLTINDECGNIIGPFRREELARLLTVSFGTPS